MRMIKPCPKCGEMGELIQYVKEYIKEPSRSLEQRRLFVDFLRVTCKVCGYQRREPCADADDRQQPTER